MIFSMALLPVVALAESSTQPTSAADKSIEETKENKGTEETEKNEAKDGKEEDEKKAKEAEEKYKKKEKEYQQANAAVADINNEITTLEAVIIDTIAEVQDLEDKVEKSQVKVDKMYDSFKGRLKAIYMSGDYTAVQAFLGSNDFADYLTKAEMIKSVSEKDEATIKKMQSAYKDLMKQKKKVEDERIKLELKEADLQTEKAALETKKAQAAKAYNESIDLLKKYDRTTKATKVQIENEQRELKKIIAMCNSEAEISKDIAAAIKSGKTDLKSEVVSNGGMLCFPVPSCRDVSCGFYGYANHNGMDFSNHNIYGKKVVAAADGKIMNVQLLDYSYGHHIWINHGKKVATLYAHLSRIVVKEGQYVKKGQVIGYVGSTGNSTGPHLHFGLLVNGVFQNPINYF